MSLELELELGLGLELELELGLQGERVFVAVGSWELLVEERPIDSDRLAEEWAAEALSM